MVGPSGERAGAATAAKDIATSSTAIVPTAPVLSLSCGLLVDIMVIRVLNALVGGARYCSLAFSLLLFVGAAPGGGAPPGRDDAGAVSPSRSLVACAATWAMLRVISCFCPPRSIVTVT